MKKFAFFGAKIGQKHVSVPFFDVEHFFRFYPKQNKFSSLPSVEWWGRDFILGPKYAYAEWLELLQSLAAPSELHIDFVLEENIHRNEAGRAFEESLCCRLDPSPKIGD